MIGNHSKRVTIKTVPYYSDTDAGLVRSPVETLCERWAQIDTISGAEAFRFAQMQVAVTHKLTLREYTSNITPKMEVLFGSRTLEIVSVLHDEMKHRWTVLYCVERS